MDTKIKKIYGDGTTLKTKKKSNYMYVYCLSIYVNKILTHHLSKKLKTNKLSIFEIKRRDDEVSTLQSASFL